MRSGREVSPAYRTGWMAGSTGAATAGDRFSLRTAFVGAATVAPFSFSSVIGAATCAIGAIGVIDSATVSRCYRRTRAARVVVHCNAIPTYLACSCSSSTDVLVACGTVQ